MAEMTFSKRMQNLVEETGQGLMHTPNRLLEASRGAFNMTREEADHLLERGENLFGQLVERGRKIEGQRTSRFQGWIRGWERRGRHQFEVAEEQLEQQIHNVLEALHIPTIADVKRLSDELDRLNKKLDARLVEIELGSLPIEGYQDMTVKQIQPLLEDLDEVALRAIRLFEESHSSRVTILRDIDQKLEAMAETA